MNGNSTENMGVSESQDQPNAERTEALRRAGEALSMMTCPYSTGGHACDRGCHSEPECQTCAPTGGWESQLLDAARALSAAEKEREGSCCCGKRAADDFHALDCPHAAMAEVLQRAGAREGDIIEKLREWIEQERVRLRGTLAAPQRAELFRLEAFLNDLQEQSTGGEG